MATQQQQTTQQTKKDTSKKTTTTTTSKPTTPAPVKAKPVISEDEVSRMIDLGLGRGVDATHASPWSMKSSFQVRLVTIGNIIGTEEGGALQAYEREISSVTTQQSSLKSSISVPQAPVAISLEGEFNRSASSTRKAVGKQVVNRTISFRADFDDIPQTSVVSEEDKSLKELDDHDIGSVAEYLYSNRRGSASPTSQAQFTFEQRLAEWILERILQRWEKDNLQTGEVNVQVKKPDIAGIDPITDIAAYLKTASQDEKKSVYHDCRNFIRHFRITHYVSAISLGAAQYRVLSENEYFKKISAGGTLGLDAVAKLVSSESYSKKSTFKASDTRQIGKIINDKVERGSYDEAVVGIKIQPIHSLVKLRYLHLALRRALLEYVDQQGDTTSGPYLIGCGNKPTIFWQVNKDEDRHIYYVGATAHRAAASYFFIIPNDDGIHPYEFRIGWASDGEKQLRRTRSSLRPDTPGHLEPLFRFLDAHVNIFGSNTGPLYLKSELHSSHSRLTLHNRVIGDNKAPIDTKVWGYGNEEFFINCARRSFRKDGFIAVKRITVRTAQGRIEERYVTICLPHEKHHNEQNVWMLFRLYPAQLRNVKAGDIADAEVKSVLEDELDDEFEGIFGKISKLPLLNLVLPQHHPAREATSHHGETQGQGAEVGVANTTTGAQGGGDKLDISGKLIDVSGGRASDKEVKFKHNDIPLNELPSTVGVRNTPI